ncbi:1, 4-beta cellobiohydrolase [Triangularia setosa]|uniref:Glucanase n=1 Tax=Triangularia setosa TaxID=2587417 RepID=A0AAN6VVV7_9PEZI|nr:1, 4-beta cellobiohydrolase [Podospora setosa]
MMASRGIKRLRNYALRALAIDIKPLGQRYDEEEDENANPWAGKKALPESSWVAKMKLVYDRFTEAGHTANANKVRTIQDIGTFFWVSNIAAGRVARLVTGEDHVVGLVVYNLPDRDCSAGELKSEYIKPYADKTSQATDLTFAIVLEAGMIVSSHFAKVFELTKELFRSNSTEIRRFSTNISNYNPFEAEVREPYTDYFNSQDESHYVDSLLLRLEAVGLPSHFITGQIRVAAPGVRKDWCDWYTPGAAVDNAHFDSISWIKPGGKSDDECGYESVPRGCLVPNNSRPSIKA